MTSSTKQLRVLTIKKNPGNGFAVIYKDLGIDDRYVMHYTSDPDKDPSTERGKQWFETVRKTMDRATWNREMEGDPYSHVGKAIFPDFRTEIHAANRIYPVEGINIIRGWDPGWCVSACVFMQIVPFEKGLPQLRILREVETFNSDFAVLVQKVKHISETEYDGYDFWDEIDIEGKTRKAASQGNTPVKILGSFGIAPRYQKSSPEERIALLNHLIGNRVQNGEPALVLDPVLCRKLLTGFLGLYRRKQDSDQIDKTEVVHLFDALGYGARNNLMQLIKFKRDEPKNAPKLVIGTGWQEEVIEGKKQKKRHWLAC